MKYFAFVAGALLLASPTVSLAQDSADEIDPVVMVDQADATMNAAIAEAQRTLPEWLAILESPPAGYSDIAFKFPLEGWEHIWVDNVQRKGDLLVGRLANVPRAEGWSQNDTVSVPLSDVSDWAYWDENGVAHGYRTVVVLFDQMAPDEVRDLKIQFGWER